LWVDSHGFTLIGEILHWIKKEPAGLRRRVPEFLLAESASYMRKPLFTMEMTASLTGIIPATIAPFAQ
jgi:hypothetical protein